MAGLIAVIGCGNPNRRDDGVGPYVIAALRARGVERNEVRLYDAGTDGMAAMFAARGCATLMIVDACQSGSTPGAVFEVPGGELEKRHAPRLNLHDFRWDHALYAGRRIFRDDFPADVTVLLIEAETVDFGVGLSDTVTRAAVLLVARIESLIGEAPARRPRPDVSDTDTVTLKRGGAYLERAICDRHFADLESVILLRRDDDLLILPVRHAAAGGYLLKIRNAAGDRVVNAPDFLREQGIGDEVERRLDAVWAPDHAGLLVIGAFSL